MPKTELDTLTVADGLRPVLLRVGRELRREAREVGVSPEQVSLLVAIKYAPGIGVRDLATRERISPPAMSNHVDRLERDGLVARTPSDSDRRRVGLTLTDEGQRVLRRVRSRRTAWLVVAPRQAERRRARRGRGRRRAALAPAARGGGPPVRRTFSSLRHRNYRLFFAGQAVSQTGSWMQRIALSWYVLQLTHGNSFAVGIMALAQFLPFTLFGLFAGVLTDRLDARRLVLGTQLAQLVTATALAAIAVSGIAQPWMLYTIAFLNGLVLVLDVPSRQQLTYRMVGRETLPNAIALNSSLFNASRIFGPSIAGILLGFAGVGVCFVVNAVSASSP